MGKGPSGPGSWAPMAHLPTVALLLLGASVTAWDICISPGDLPAPELFLNTSKAQEGEWVLLRCSIDRHSPATQIVFYKDGVEEHSLKAEWGQLTYSKHLIMTNGNVGTYTCGYYRRSRFNHVRNSALSNPQNLTVTDSVPSPGTVVPIRDAPPAPRQQRLHSRSIPAAQEDTGEWLDGSRLPE